MTNIHSTAIVDSKARLGKDVVIGPYCTVGGKVSLGDGVRLESHVVITGNTSVGAGSHIFPFTSLGMIPQDMKYHEEESLLEIGQNTVIREHVTMNGGTENGGGITRVGDHGLFMAGSHVAHDCQVANHVIFSNNATLGGHCIVEDYATIGGLAACHQYVRIGRHAFVGGMSGVVSDVLPFAIATGNKAYLAGINVVGLKRAGFTQERIRAVRQVYETLFAGTTVVRGNVERVRAKFPDNADVKAIIDFMREDAAQRPLCTPRSKT